MINYSVIVPVYNQCDMIVHMIKFYNALYKVRQDFEVIWSDDGSSDNTRKYMESKNANKLFPFQYFWSPDVGFTVSAAKNRGIARANGKYVLILDGDTFIDPGTLSAYDHIKKDDDTVYFGKRFPVRLKDLDKALHYGFPTVVRSKSDWRGFLQDIPPAPFNHFSGSNFLMSTKLAKELGYGCENFKNYGYEDYYMAIKYLVAGKKFQAVNDSVAYHCEDKPKEGHPRTRQQLNDFIDENKAALDAMGQPIRYF